MKLDRLIELLEDLRDELRGTLGDDCDPDVVAAYQPSYPLSGTVDGVCCLPEDGDGVPILVNGEPVVWIAIGTHPHNMSPYAPSVVFEEARR